MGTFDRMQAELHSRWFNKLVRFKNTDTALGLIRWRVVDAYYSPDEDKPQVTIAKLVIHPIHDHARSMEQVVEVNEVERI